MGVARMMGVDLYSVIHSFALRRLCLAVALPSLDSGTTQVAEDCSRTRWTSRGNVRAPHGFAVGFRGPVGCGYGRRPGLEVQVASDRVAGRSSAAHLDESSPRSSGSLHDADRFGGGPLMRKLLLRGGRGHFGTGCEALPRVRCSHGPTDVPPRQVLARIMFTTRPWARWVLWSGGPGWIRLGVSGQCPRSQAATERFGRPGSTVPLPGLRRCFLHVLDIVTGPRGGPTT